MNICICRCVYRCVHIYICIDLRICMYIHTYRYMYACMYTYMHMYIHVTTLGCMYIIPYKKECSLRDGSTTSPGKPCASLRRATIVFGPSEHDYTTRMDKTSSHRSSVFGHKPEKHSPLHTVQAVVSTAMCSRKIRINLKLKPYPCTLPAHDVSCLAFRTGTDKGSYRRIHRQTESQSNLNRHPKLVHDRCHDS